MQNDDEKKSVEKAPFVLDKAWVRRAFPVFYGPVRPTDAVECPKIDLRPRPPSRIGDLARLYRNPERAKKLLTFVGGAKLAENLYLISESIHIEHAERLTRAALSNWFIQPEATTPFLETLQACADDDVAIQEVFAALIRDRIAHIRCRMVKDFPKRAEILNEAFTLHGERRYIAAIPLFLTMAEGITKEVTEKSAFNSGPGVAEGHRPPKVFDWLVTQNFSPVVKMYISALVAEHPFSRTQREGHLSRHRVLHGNVVDYGTEIFSLQAISILGLVGWAFSADGLASMSLTASVPSTPSADSNEPL